MNNKKIRYEFIMGENRLLQTNHYLRTVAEGRKFEPDILVIIDAFSEKTDPYNQLCLLECLAKDINPSIKTYYYSHDKSYYTPHDSTKDVKTLLNDQDFQTNFQSSQKIFIVMPYTVGHYFMSRVFFKETRHYGLLNHSGEIFYEASWVFRQEEWSQFDRMLCESMSYNTVFPDCIGSGANILTNYFMNLEILENKYTGREININAIERVKNSHRLAKCKHRTPTKRDSVYVNAYGFGWFHTGSLIKFIKRKWPITLNAVIIKGNTHSPLLKNSTEEECFIATMDERDVSAEWAKEHGIKILSPNYFSIPIKNLTDHVKTTFEID